MFAFGDNASISNLLAYLSSPEEFENALVPYDKPIIRTNGGIFGIGEKRYAVRCPFDLNLFTLLEQGQRLDLYEYIRDFLQKHTAIIKRVIQLVAHALHFRSDPATTLSFFYHFYNEFGRIGRNFIYLSLRNIDSLQIEHLFDSIFNALALLEKDVTETLQNMHQYPLENTRSQSVTNPNESDKQDNRLPERYSQRQKNKRARHL